MNSEASPYALKYQIAAKLLLPSTTRIQDIPVPLAIKKHILTKRASPIPVKCDTIDVCLADAYSNELGTWSL
jgi:hypothetical protein